MEIVFEEIEVGLGPQKNFAQMDENGNVKDGIWGQVVHLNPPMKEKAKDEI